MRSCDSVLADRQFTPSAGEPPRRRVYRRLPTSAVGAALASSALADQSDQELLGLLHRWRDAADGFNRRLDLTELRMFLTDKPDEVRKFDQILHDNADRLRRQLIELQHSLPAGKKPSTPDESAERYPASAAVTRHRPDSTT